MKINAFLWYEIWKGRGKKAWKNADSNLGWSRQKDHGTRFTPVPPEQLFDNGPFSQDCDDAFQRSSAS